MYALQDTEHVAEHGEQPRQGIKPVQSPTRNAILEQKQIRLSPGPGQ